MMSKTLILAPVMAVALTACNKNEDAAAPGPDILMPTPST